MKRLSSLVVLIAILGAAALGQDAKAFASKLDSQLRGQEVTLRSLACGGGLEFDETGTLKRPQPTGPWTLCALVKVSKVNWKKDRLRIDGTRLGVKYKEHESRVKIENVTILIDSADPEHLRQAVEAIFLKKSEKLSDVAPSYWRCYLEHPGEKLSWSLCGRENGIPAINRISKDMRPPKPIYDPDPQFSEWARADHYQGTVVLGIEISKDGNVTDVQILRPLGLGLDDKSAEIVRTWRFQPALDKDGHPVTVRVNVEVNFHMM